MKYLCLLLLAPLAGCAYTTYLSGADEHGVRVNLVTDLNQDSAVQKAKDHCAKYNLVARVTDTDLASSTLSFVCQPPR
jgi:hypothetical protein